MIRLGYLMCAMLIASQAPATEYKVVKNQIGTFHLFKIAPSDLTIHWLGEDGKPMRTFERLEESLKKSGRRSVFMMNGGIFEPGGNPTGLHIEAGKELRPLNLRDGRGNFFLKPNGVFLIENGTAHVVNSEIYAAGNLQPRLALQSGPLLLENGKIHPAFRAASKNLKHRNGVGILPDGNLLFMMTDLKTETRTNLHQFASLFLKFQCKNALFLDGDLSMADVDLPGDENDLKHDPEQELVPGVKTGNEFGRFCPLTNKNRRSKNRLPTQLCLVGD